MENSGSRTGKILRYIYDHTEVFLSVIFCVMLVTDVLLGILARFVRFEVVFATELGKYLFIWLCAIGISAAAKDNQHVRINFLVAFIPVSRKLTWVISQVFFLLFSLFFIYLGIRLTLMHIEMGKTAMGFNFPMYVFTAALPVGFLLTSIRLMIDIYKSLSDPLHYHPWEGQTPQGLPDSQIRDEQSEYIDINSRS